MTPRARTLQSRSCLLRPLTLSVPTATVSSTPPAAEIWICDVLRCVQLCRFTQCSWIMSGWCMWSGGVPLSPLEFFLGSSFVIAFGNDVSCPGRPLRAPEEMGDSAAVSSITCRFEADCWRFQPILMRGKKWREALPLPGLYDTASKNSQIHHHPRCKGRPLDIPRRTVFGNCLGYEPKFGPPSQQKSQ